VVLSSSIEPEPPFFAGLASLCERATRPVFLGGATAAAHEKEVHRAGAIPLGVAIEPALERIGAELRGKGILK
jgi:hypothetical protein